MSERAPEPPVDDGLTAEGRTFDEGYKAGYAAAVEARVPHEPPAVSQMLSDYADLLKLLARELNAEASQKYHRGFTIEQIRSAAQASRAAPPLDWQPIETAPKTSHHILVWTPANQCTSLVSWTTAWKPEGEWRHAFGSDQLLDEPTHWRALADPPAAVPQP